MTPPAIITGLNGLAIYNYNILPDCIRLSNPGGFCLITSPDEIRIFKRWIKEAKSFAKNTNEICSYLEYMLDFGQYENQ